MLLLALSAAFVGLVHSLAPGHWLPVVLMTKARRWNVPTAILGALTAASGHIFVSVTIGIIGLKIGAHYFTAYEEQIEKYGGVMLIAFGLIYAIHAYFRHSHCHGHEHHGPDPANRKGPFLFLFTLGFSPCVAVLPVFVAAAPLGVAAIFFTMLAFGLGVTGAFIAGTVLVSRGVVKLDHPILEHHGDVITGLGVSAMGTVLFFLHHFGR